MNCNVYETLAFNDRDTEITRKLRSFFEENIHGEASEIYSI